MGCNHNDKNRQVVMRLFDAILDNDRDRILSFFNDDSVFQPLARDPAVGHAAIWASLTAAASEAQAVEQQLDRITGHEDGRVRAERTERYLVDGSWRERRVTGELAVKGCKIIRWLDAESA
jgi:limonene-1,2-epoxide hydrolase